ncbi:hypothetical protein FOZ61_009916 [Perkinsus olseni]|uniref:Uncharacterized protein n=1 Tax=Perkinsus olseni TaxID=32597 RepID=A0A7J6M4B4_PEROL|nr:hypothetical protein FOZ61_009916 [Perkinsus olseni]
MDVYSASPLLGMVGGPLMEGGGSSLYHLVQRINALSRPGVVATDVTRFMQDAAKSLGTIQRLDRPFYAHLGSILQFSSRFAQPEDSAVLVRCSLPHLKAGLVAADDTVIASILNSVSKVPGIEPGFASSAGETVRASGILETGRIVAVITAMRALTRLGYEDQEGQLYPRVRELILSRVDDLCPEDLCSALHVFTGHKRYTAGDALLGRIEKRLLDCPEIQGSTAASLLYCLSGHRYSDRSLVDRLGRAVVLSAESMDVDSITLALTALSSFDGADQKLFMAIAEPLTRRLDELRPRNVVAVVHAAAKTRFYDYRMLSHMVHCALDHLGLAEFSVVELGMLIQGLTKLKFGSNSLYVSLFTVIAERSEPSPVALSMALDAVRRKFNAVCKRKGPSHHVSSQLRLSGPLIDSMAAVCRMSVDWLQTRELSSVRTRELTQIISCLAETGQIHEEEPARDVIGRSFSTLSWRIADGSGVVGEVDRRFIAHAWRMWRASLPAAATTLTEEARRILDDVERAYPDSSKTPVAGERIMRGSGMRKNFDSAVAGHAATEGQPVGRPAAATKSNTAVVDDLFDSVYYVTATVSHSKMVVDISDILYYLVSIPLTLWLCRIFTPTFFPPGQWAATAKVPQVDIAPEPGIGSAPSSTVADSNKGQAAEEENIQDSEPSAVKEAKEVPTAEDEAAEEHLDEGAAVLPELLSGAVVTEGPEEPRTPEIDAEAAAQIAAAAALVNEATRTSKGPPLAAGQTSLLGTPPVIISTNEQQQQQQRQDGAVRSGHQGEPPGFEIYRANSSSGHTRQPPPPQQQEVAGGYRNHCQQQPTANEFEIQRNILAAANSRSVNSLLLIVDMHLNELNSVNVSTLIHRLASITQNQEQSQRALARDARVKQILQRAIELAPTSSCQSLSNICWAIGKLQMVEEKDVVQAIVEAAKTRLDHFRPQNFSNMLYGLSRVGYCDRELMELVAGKVANTLCTFKPQELSNLLYAYGRLNCYNEELLQEICSCVAAMMPRYDGQGVGNVMCSLAKLNYPCGHLMDAVAADVALAPHKYGKFLISKILRPMHSLGYTNLPMLMTTSRYVLDNLAAVRVDEISTVMQGFAQEGVKAPPSGSHEPLPSSSSGLLDYEAASQRVDALMQAAALKLSTVAKLEEVSLEKIVQLFNLMASLGMKSKPNNGGFLLSACARILQNLDTLGEEQIKSILRSCASMELALTSFEERLLSELADPDDPFIIGASSSTATGTASCSSPQSFFDAPAASESMPVDLLSADGVPMLPESVAECGWTPESLQFLLETDAEHLGQYHHDVKEGRGGARW